MNAHPGILAFGTGVRHRVISYVSTTGTSISAVWHATTPVTIIQHISVKRLFFYHPIAPMSYLIRNQKQNRKSQVLY